MVCCPKTFLMAHRFKKGVNRDNGTERIYCCLSLHKTDIELHFKHFPMGWARLWYRPLTLPTYIKLKPDLLHEVWLSRP